MAEEPAELSEDDLDEMLAGLIDGLTGVTVVAIEQARRVMGEGMTPFIARSEILDAVQASQGDRSEAIHAAFTRHVDAVLDAHFAALPRPTEE